MLQALTRGKLSREQENMEDILTSEVFGLLRYVDVAEGLMPFLSQAESLNGSRPLANLGAPISVQEWCFWPRWQEPHCQACEPDVYIRLTTASGASFAVGIEAKYWSGKSNSDPSGDSPLTDQLAKQWDNLRHIADRQQTTPTLIYLTTHSSMPREELDASIADYERMRRDDARPLQLAWLSWRRLPQLFADHPEAALRDIAGLADRLNLKLFNGFSEVQPISSLTWRFHAVRDTRWNWMPGVLEYATPWSFSR